MALLFNNMGAGFPKSGFPFSFGLELGLGESLGKGKAFGNNFN